MTALLKFFLILCLVCPWAGGAKSMAQDRSNPFEITSRLPAEEGRRDTSAVAARPEYTPFDIRRAAGAEVVGQSSVPTDNGSRPSAGLAAGQSPAAQKDARSGLLVIQSSDPNKGKGAVVAIQIILLVALASLWVLFGGLLRQCIRGAVNGSLMNQIYTRRSGGEETALWICYLFFFFAFGFFLHLMAARFNVSLGMGVWGSWLTFTLLVAAAVGLKQWIVWVIGRLFPVRKEVSRYAFVLMVFSILAGLVFVPTNLGVTYAPEGLRDAFLYGGAALGAVIYLLHLTRGIFIVGPLAATRPVHLLLYICAIEIAPLLLVYRYLNNSLI